MTSCERSLSCYLCMEDETVANDALDRIIYCYLCFGRFWWMSTYICAITISYCFTPPSLHGFCVHWHTQFDLIIWTFRWDILPLNNWVFYRWYDSDESDHTSLSEYFPLYLTWCTHSSECFDTAWKRCIGWYDRLTPYWCNSS